MELDRYDPGLLPDFNGGVVWWQDCLRCALGSAHEFYQSQVATLAEQNQEGILMIHALVNERNAASEKAADLQRQLDDVMESIKKAAMPHGDCKSGERYGGIPKACTACMAKMRLDELTTQWKGRQVQLT